MTILACISYFSLAINHIYKSLLNTGALDSYDLSPADDLPFCFRTASNGCNPPPTVISITPLNGATGVCSLAVITATFSEAMYASSLNTTTFTVIPGVTESITHDVTDIVFTFTPSSLLAIYTVY